MVSRLDITWLHVRVMWPQTSGNPPVPYHSRNWREVWANQLYRRWISSCPRRVWLRRQTPNCFTTFLAHTSLDCFTRNTIALELWITYSSTCGNPYVPTSSALTSPPGAIPPCVWQAVSAFRPRIWHLGSARGRSIDIYMKFFVYLW